MNLWQCNHTGCGRTCVGVGGAIGLRAIGWYFRTGPIIFCPAHRPDGIDGNGKYSECMIPNCSPCAATEEAEKLQKILKTLEP